MRTGWRTVAVGLVSAAVVAGSWLGASSALGAAQHTNRVVFMAQHIHGVKGLVLVEGSGLVVYTFNGDKPGHAATCTGACAAIWPEVRGVARVASGTHIAGKFGRINGQITYNGLPLYLFTGEKAHQNHAGNGFKVVHPTASSAPTPQPSPTYTPGPMPTPTSTSTYMY